MAAQHELILGHLDEEVNPQLAYLDDYDSQAVKQRAMNNVNTAFHAHQQQTQQFDNQINLGSFPIEYQGTKHPMNFIKQSCVVVV